MPLFLILFFALLPGARAIQENDSPKPTVFPALSAFSLDKAKVNLPADFAGKANLLLISFQPEQAKDIETWMPFAQALQHMNFNFRYYKMPVSNPENMIYRWWDTSSLRSVESDPESWHWVVPLYINKEDFRRSLNIPNEKDIVALLTDKNGQILWRAAGPFNDDKKASLTTAVAAATR
ncbi:MAG TPA: hypothetical protein VHT24_08120 [Pseudacidobacterium sp.]|nr:hypothetical protein [Pseudacidobacterium sp.]